MALRHFDAATVPAAAFRQISVHCKLRWTRSIATIMCGCCARSVIWCAATAQLLHRQLSAAAICVMLWCRACLLASSNISLIFALLLAGLISDIGECSTLASAPAKVCLRCMRCWAGREYLGLLSLLPFCGVLAMQITQVCCVSRSPCFCWWNLQLAADGDKIT